PAHPRDTGVPHPALAPQTAAGQDETRVPTPQDRLRAAFSSEADLPEDMLEPPGSRRDALARYDVDPPAAPREIRKPIIRGVGVGGAGVNAVNRMVEAHVAGVEFVAVNTDLH